MGAADACLICLYIMTSPNMPKRVYIEEVIDRVILYIKFHLHNTIFPSFDATYRLDNKKRGNTLFSVLQTFVINRFLDGRKKKSTQVCQKSIVHLYSKICEVVKSLAELLTIQVLTDTSILHLSSMGVSPFFAENVSDLQLSCLKLVTTVSLFLHILLDTNQQFYFFCRSLRVMKRIVVYFWMIFWLPSLGYQARNAVYGLTG